MFLRIRIYPSIYFNWVKNIYKRILVIFAIQKMRNIEPYIGKACVKGFKNFPKIILRSEENF